MKIGLRAFAFVVSLCLASVALAQCDPYTGLCPVPQTRPAGIKSQPTVPYVFNEASGNPKPWASAVRITIRAGKSITYGSGTIVKTDGNTSLVMTAAHVLRGGGPYRVEVFDGQVDPRTGIISGRVGEYPGDAIDVNYAHDVGLLRFRADRPQVASPLVERGWYPEGHTLCSVGCPSGGDPQVISEQFIRRTEFTAKDGVYPGLELARAPEPGRSGGGLFDENGRLAGVCDFADPKNKTGLYATTLSLREILRKNGFVETADGRLNAQPSPGSSPRPADPIGSLEKDVVGLAEKEATAFLKQIITGLSIAFGAMILGLFAYFFKGKTPPSAGSVVSAPSGIPSPEDLTRLLSASLKAHDAAEAQKRSDAELLDKIRALMNTPSPNA